MVTKILVDSASDIDLEEAKEYGVELIPMEISFGNETYEDGVTLSHDEFFEKLIETDVMPKTSRISAYRFEEKFAGMTEEDEETEIVCITLSSELSGTYDEAKRAAANFGGKVYVVDSFTASLGERILLEYAVLLLKQGLSAREIVERLEEKKKDIRLIALMGTLKYLKKGGRISPLVAISGELLNVKPVIAVEGSVKMLGKALGSKRGNNLLSESIVKAGGVDFSMPFTTAYSGFDSSVLDKYIADGSSLWKSGAENVTKHKIGSTIGTHIGPGAIAVAFFMPEPGKTD